VALIHNVLIRNDTVATVAHTSRLLAAVRREADWMSVVRGRSIFVSFT
jgi:hypothetical protein